MILSNIISKLLENKQLIIFLMSLAFIVGIVSIWILIVLISRAIKKNNHYKRIAREELASLGFSEFGDKKVKSNNEYSEEPIIIDLTKKEDNIVDQTSNEILDENVKEEVEVEVVAEDSTIIEDIEAVEELAVVNEDNTAEDNIADESLDDNADLVDLESTDEDSNIDSTDDSELSIDNTDAVEVEQDNNDDTNAVEVEATDEEEVSKDPKAEEIAEEAEPEVIEAVKPVKKGRTYNGKYEIFQIADGFAYHLKASNGEILVTSETYRSREGVLKAIEAVKRNLETGEVRIFADKRGKYKFKLVSKNYRVLAISSNYSVEKSAVRASESFKKFAVKADIVDIELVDKDAKTATLIEIIANEDKPDGRFVIEKFDGEYSWDLKASNGQILCQAEGYTSKAGCYYSIDTFKRNVENGVFKCVKDKTGRYCYKLYTPSGRVCAVGESYNTKSGAESAANSVVSYFKLADIIEVKN